MINYCFSMLLLIASIFSLSSFVGSTPSKNIVNARNERIEQRKLHHIFELDSEDASNVVVDHDRNLVYVGAVNYLYALDLDNVEIKKQELRWAPDDDARKTCENFINDREICRNSIRLLHTVNSTHLYACGTMTLTPECIFVDKKTFTQSGNSIRGKWKLPKSPISSTVSTISGGSLFTAIDNPSQNMNGGIYKTRLDEDRPVKTNEDDDFWLSDPQFVSVFTVPEQDRQQEKVIVLLKENAEEIPLEILTQDSDYSVNIVYSRLATICSNDLGMYKWIAKDRLATFTKMRIACPVEIKRKNSRTIPFFYDEIQSSYLVHNPEQPDNPSIYAIFSTPKGAFQATATCVYEMKDIREYMSTNKYWNRPNKSPKIFQTYEGSDPAPGTCVQNTTRLSESRSYFGNDHPLKYGIIKPKQGYAIYQDTGAAYSHIIVDRISREEKIGKAIGLFRKEYDVVHYITESGLIKRVVFSVEDRSVHWEIPSRRVFDEFGDKQTVLTVEKNNGFLYFGTTKSIVQMRIASCSDYLTCGDCAMAKDPYCDWDEFDIACKEINFSLPIKTPAKLHEKLNETRRCQLYPDRMSGINSDKHATAEDVAKLRRSNDDLLKLTQEQNKTIHQLQSEKSLLVTQQADTMFEMSNLMNNYSHLSALLLQYDTRRKLVIQLYRDTAFKLLACQSEKNQRKAAEKKALTELKAAKNATARCRQSKRMEAEAETRVRDLEFPNPFSRDVFTKKLDDCETTSGELRSEIKTLKQLQKNMTLKNKVLEDTISMMKQETSKLAAHTTSKKDCVAKDHWIYYEPTNKLFFVTHDSVTFSEAVKDCTNLGGTMAILKDEGETRYIFNVTHSLASRKRYWIGLRKDVNGVLRWLDGSTFHSDAVADRFSKSQIMKIRSRIDYCVETTHKDLQWQLIPCHKHRRVICMKEYSGEIR